MNRVLRSSLLCVVLMFLASKANAGLVITEVMYEPISSGGITWFEILNAGSTAEELNLYSLHNENGLVADFFESGSPVESLAIGEIAVIASRTFVEGEATSTLETEWNAPPATKIYEVGFPSFQSMLSGDDIKLFKDGTFEVELNDFRNLTSIHAGNGQSIFRENVGTGETPVWSLSEVLLPPGTVIPPNSSLEAPAGSPGSIPFSSTAVPEPSSVLVFAGIGLMGLVRLRRSRRDS